MPIIKICPGRVAQGRLSHLRIIVEQRVTFDTLSKAHCGCGRPDREIATKDSCNLCAIQRGVFGQLEQRRIDALVAQFGRRQHIVDDLHLMLKQSVGANIHPNKDRIAPLQDIFISRPAMSSSEHPVRGNQCAAAGIDLRAIMAWERADCTNGDVGLKRVRIRFNTVDYCHRGRAAAQQCAIDEVAYHHDLNSLEVPQSCWQ